MVTLAEQVGSGGRRQKTQAGSTRAIGWRIFSGINKSLRSSVSSAAGGDFVPSRRSLSRRIGMGKINFSAPDCQLRSPDLRAYYLQDANWDTTAIVGYNSTTDTWGATQRYVYSPYGSITVLNADWTTTPVGTQPLVNNLYQGMTLDAVTGLYYERFRNYSPTLGTWISQDPLSYVNGANTYQFVGGNPADSADPRGLGRQGNYPVQPGYLPDGDPPVPPIGITHNYGPNPNWGRGAGPLIFNYEFLKLKVCPEELGKAIDMARQQVGTFAAFNNGNIATVGLSIKNGGVYAEFGINNLFEAFGGFMVGNDNIVRLLWGQNYPYTEAVTQDNHFLVGIRRWYVMPFSKDSFIVFTEAYERANGGLNNWLNPKIHIESTTFEIWNTELINVATWVKGMKGGATWGRPMDHWQEMPGQTNASGNPWLGSLPSSER